MTSQNIEPTHQHILQRLRIVRWVAVADLVLLVLLVTASQLDNRTLVSILGPLHGGNFLLLLVVIYTGVTDRLWSWLFFLGTLITGGPLGAFIGEFMINRRLKRMKEQA